MRVACLNADTALIAFGGPEQAGNGVMSPPIERHPLKRLGAFLILAPCRYEVARGFTICTGAAVIYAAV